jgi:hypothetical protein
MSCLFDSLSTFIVNLNSTQLRQAICDYLETNPLLMDDLKAENVIEGENGMKLENYVRIMRNQNTMGGAIEIRAFINIFKINIRVKSIPNNRLIEFLVDKENQWKELVWTGGHFDPVVDLT